MLVKEAKYKDVQVTRKEVVSQAVYGCDECREELEEHPNEDSRLTVGVFRNDDDDNVSLHFCSWECLFKHASKIETDFFFDLPNVCFDYTNEKRNPKALFELMKKCINK